MCSQFIADFSFHKFSSADPCRQAWFVANLITFTLDKWEGRWWSHHWILLYMTLGLDVGLFSYSGSQKRSPFFQKEALIPKALKWRVEYEYHWRMEFDFVSLEFAVKFVFISAVLLFRGALEANVRGGFLPQKWVDDPKKGSHFWKRPQFWEMRSPKWRALGQLPSLPPVRNGPGHDWNGQICLPLAKHNFTSFDCSLNFAQLWDSIAYD